MPARVDPLTHYIPVPESGCWLWLGKARPDGYGSHRTGLAHRLSYEAANGPIENGLLVCHKCDTRTCINPAHLFVGHHSDNHDDMRKKGRQAVGVTHGMAKLSDSDVSMIREMLTAGIPQSKIAVSFGVTQSMVSRIKRGVAWYGGKFSRMPA